MAMGKRPAARQGSPLWVTTADLPTNAGHPFFERLNQVLDEAGFDAFVEGMCAVFYAARIGRPSLRPGRYFRMLLIGYFEGLSSERGIAWRVADSVSLRSCVDASSIVKPFLSRLVLHLLALEVVRDKRHAKVSRLLPLNEGQPFGWSSTVSRTVGRGSHPQGRNEIGIGGSLATPPLPHHRAYGSVHGGSTELSGMACGNGCEAVRAKKALGSAILSAGLRLIRHGPWALLAV
jgi:hypothetical protein